MTEKLLDVRRVRAAREQQRCARVPEIVPAYVGQTGTLEKGLEVPIYGVLSVQRCTPTRGKDEP
jgi:hypothetical protein